MINVFTKVFTSPVRNITAKAELYSGSALVDTFQHDGALQAITVERVGEESKFFGFGVCQKINVKLRDVERQIAVTTDNSFKITIGGIMGCPVFYVTETNRDENTNKLSITAYDAINAAAAHKAAELNLTAPYTIRDVATACANLLGVELLTAEKAAEQFALSYDDGANLDGTETIRELLNAIAEATQTIYYMDYKNRLVFKRLDKDGSAVYEINKDKYFSLDSKTNRRLSAICSATELGNNFISSMDITGTTQYIRNNPFLDLREDIADIVDNALAAVGGITINQFDCSWRGYPAVEIGDKIALTTKDNNTVNSYVLNDTWEYNGAFKQKTKWAYVENAIESMDNPTSLGDALKQTFAKVDKANKQIEMVASKAASNSENISRLQIETNSISASVSGMKEQTAAAIDNVNDSISKLNTTVEAKMSAEDVTLEIQTALENGVTKVETTTGFTFNEEGLTVSKTGSEMNTTITEDGMTVYKNNKAVLTANNIGVDAVNLHATTYLIVGTNSRFEDYGRDRTGCFWIGG